MSDTAHTIWRKIIALSIIAILCSQYLIGCSSEEPPTEASYVSPYTWSNLKNEGGRFWYYKNDERVSRTGIDVSEHNREIDWAAVAADGIEFAFIRVGNRGYTKGDLYVDPYFFTNIEQAEAAGIKCGVYFFSQAITEAEAHEEAEFVLNILDGRALEYPVAFDHEPVEDSAGRANHLTSQEMTVITETFCERIENGGYRSMVYGNKQDISRVDNAVLSRFEVWFAEYESAIPSAQFDFSIWQYSSSGAVVGIETPVDMNIHFLEAE